MKEIIETPFRSFGLHIPTRYQQSKDTINHHALFEAQKGACALTGVDFLTWTEIGLDRAGAWGKRRGRYRLVHHKLADMRAKSPGRTRIIHGETDHGLLVASAAALMNDHTVAEFPITARIWRSQMILAFGLHSLVTVIPMGSDWSMNAHTGSYAKHESFSLNNPNLDLLELLKTKLLAAASYYCFGERSIVKQLMCSVPSNT